MSDTTVLKKVAQQSLSIGCAPVAVSFCRVNAITTAVDGGDVTKADPDTSLGLIGRCNKAEPKPADIEALHRWMARDGVTVRAEGLHAWFT